MNKRYSGLKSQTTNGKNMTTETKNKGELVNQKTKLMDYII